MTELAKKETELVKRSFWEPTQEDLDTLKNHLCSDLDEQEFKLFLYVCKARGLNPLLRQIYAVKYPGWGGKPGKVSHITSIEGFLLIAERTGEYEGYEDELVYDKKGNAIARCTVFRKGKRPARVECDYWEFCQTVRDNKGGDVPNKMWRKMPRWMLQKCALARALDRAFPEELGGLYIQDEMPSQHEVLEETPREVQLEQARTRQALPAPVTGGAGMPEKLEPRELAPEPMHRATPPTSSSPQIQAQSAAKPLDGANGGEPDWEPELPEHGHPAYRAWLTELSQGSHKRELIGRQKLPYLRNYLINYKETISGEEKQALSLVIGEMARQYVKHKEHKDAALKLKAEERMDSAFGGMHEYEVAENGNLLQELGKTKVIGGKHKGVEFERLETDYLDGHLEANRGNLGDEYEKALTQYLILRKGKERQEARAFTEDDIPASYTNKGEA